MSDITRDYSFGGWLRRFRISREITLRKMSLAIKMDCGNYSKLELSRLAPPNCVSKIKAITKPLKLNENEESILFTAAFSYHLANLKEKFEK